MAAYVANDHRQAAVLHGDVVEIVSAGGLGRAGGAGDIEAGQRQGRGREKFLLNAPGNADLFAQALGFPVLARPGQLLFVLLLLRLPQPFGLALDLLRLAKYVHKHGHLGTEHFRDNRLEQVIHSPQRVALEHLQLILLKGGQKNDRRMLRALAFANQGGRLETVHARHLDIH